MKTLKLNFSGCRKAFWMQISSLLPKFLVVDHIYESKIHKLAYIYQYLHTLPWKLMVYHPNDSNKHTAA